MVDRRIFLIVLDSYGIGELPDAKEFGDEGCNTLRSITGSKEYDTPWMKKMGLFNIEGVEGKEGVESPIASYARLAETSKEKILPSVIGKLQVLFLKDHCLRIPMDFLRSYWTDFQN